MADQVDEIKQKTDIVALIGEYISVKKAGRNYKAVCPFHSEKTPSFMISPELQMYKCFGCGEAGDAYSFLEKYEGMEFREALKFLADKAGITLQSYDLGDGGEKERLYQLNSQTLKFYHYVLLSHPAGKYALDYFLKERGLNLETIKTFSLGYSPDFPNALKKFVVDKKHFTLKEIEKAGLGYFKGTFLLDKFRGRAIFPLFDHRGNTVGFAGRILPNAKDKEMAKYINTPESPVYHKSNLLFGLNLVKNEIKQKGEVVVVEGELDMISSWQAGIKNVVAIKGSALTEEQVGLLNRFTKKIILALDSDFAGDLAARRGIVIAQKVGMEVKVARFGKYKDPDEAARGNPEFYRKALEEAVGVWDFLIDSVFSLYQKNTGEGKAKISQEIVPILASIPDKIVQAHYIGIVASKLNVPNEAVYEQIMSNKEEKEEIKVLVTAEKIEKGRKQLLEERLLTLAFQSNPVFLQKEKIARLISTPLTKRILEEYLQFSKDNGKFSPSEFTEKLPKELVNGYAEMALKDLEDLVESPEGIQREMLSLVWELEMLDLNHKLEILGAKIREYENAQEPDKLKKALQKFSELSLKLSKYKNEAKGGIILQEE